MEQGEIGRFSFNVLKLEKLLEYTYPENATSLGFSTRFFGFKINKLVHDEKRNLDFQNLILEPEDFKLTEPQIMEILYNR